jgi:hypothetical protein
MFTGEQLKKTKFEKIESILFALTAGGILSVLIYNLFHFDQLNGYDGLAHHQYVQSFVNMYWPGLQAEPSASYTYEFFSPPLPYLFPATLNEICKIYLQSENIYEYCRIFYSFNNIILQSILFIFTLFLYMKIIKRLTGSSKMLNLSVLLILGIFTANYRTISMLRGETYILFLNSFLLYRMLILFQKSFKYEKVDVILCGMTIGLLALSRQWAFLLFPAYFLIYFLIKNHEEKKYYFKFLFYIFSIGFFISSWFYFGLFFEYGTFTAFNKDPVPFNFSNQPLSFYLPYGDEVSMVFTKPIRPYFANQFLPILYSDLWGDYWGYFTFTAQALDLGRNQLLIGDYLARVTIVSLLPTSLLILGFKTNFKNLKLRVKSYQSYFISYLILSILVSFFGYLWFLISYPEQSGDTNKATYIIHLFHLLGLSAVYYLEKIKSTNIRIYYLWIFILSVVFIHNYKAMTSHFPMLDNLSEIVFYFS